jgi:hypothetical protein
MGPLGDNVMSLKFALRSAAVFGLLIVLSSAAQSQVVAAGKCNVNAISWRIPHDGLSTSEQSPVDIPHTRTNFTLAAPGCVVVQVTAEATQHTPAAKSILTLVLDDGVVTNQFFGTRPASTQLLTTTRTFWDLPAGAHHVSLQAHSDNGDQISVTPLVIAVHYRK